jgi:nicotinamide riboside transporter PnuC
VTTQFWLSMVMGVFGILGLLIAGKGRWEGWLIGLLVQPVWAAYFISTGGWAGLILPVGYGWVYGKNLLAWWRADQQRGGEEMSLTKHGHGDVLKEDGDLAKQAATTDEAEVLAALNEENEEADR